jgi:hypothetical protein
MIRPTLRFSTAIFDMADNFFNRTEGFKKFGYRLGCPGQIAKLSLLCKLFRRNQAIPFALIAIALLPAGPRVLLAFSSASNAAVSTGVWALTFLLFVPALSIRGHVSKPR